VWYDVLGLDSEYDYDPVWAKCVELGIAPTFHSASSNQGLRLSPTNFVYNHIGHFDVIDMRDPLPEAYELVEDEHITADDFRAFTFTNAVNLWGAQNSRFFAGTRVAKEATAVLAAAQTPTLAAAE
jgi:hypothetical protein